MTWINVLSKKQTGPRVNLSPLYNKKTHSFPLPQNAPFLCVLPNLLFMNSFSDTAGASPPAQSVEISPDTKSGRLSDSDGVGGPTIKINVSYGSSLHQIHLPAQSTFGEFLFSLSFNPRILFDN